MIRDLRLSDLPRQLLPGGLTRDDWAYTRATLSGETRSLSHLDLLRWSISSSRTRRAVVAIERARIVGLALVQARNGPRAWEVAHLFTAADAVVQAGELLDRCVGVTAQQGGERLFLRVLYRGAMQDVARKAGFMPAYTEETFGLRRPLTVEVDAPVLPMRPVLPVDAHGLFRLYNFCVPAQARAMVALTLDQWTDAAEEPEGETREYVWEEDGHLLAWLRITHREQVADVDAMLHPEHGDAAPALLAAAAHIARAHRAVTWTVPSYQPALSLTLQRRGWGLQQTYAVLARSAASRVKEPALMPVQA